jgi:hypothetical protein
MRDRVLEADLARVGRSGRLSVRDHDQRAVRGCRAVLEAQRLIGM